MERAWDAILQQASVPANQTLTQSRPPTPNTADLLSHFYFEGRTDYFRYSSSFTGLPTVTGVINAPFTGEFNPNGIPYPPAFQPAANRVYSFLDGGTRGWLSDRLQTHFALRYWQDLTSVSDAAPARNLTEAFPGARHFEFLDASADVRMAAGTSITLGRQDVYGAELAVLDGASVTLDRQRYSVTVFGGRRATFFSDPADRVLGGANLLVRLGPGASLEYSGLWYLKGSQRLDFRKQLTPAWLLRTYLRSYGGSPVDFSADSVYASHSGHTTLRLGFFEKLTNKDYPYDFTYNSQDRLYLGPIPPYSQLAVEAERGLRRAFSVGGSLTIRRLNHSQDQQAFLTSFQDYQAHVQWLPLRRTEFLFTYHEHDSDRLSSANTTAFDDISTSGETSVKDVSAEFRRSFADGRVTLGGGGYYRRVSLQDAFLTIAGMHQAGWLAGASWRVDPGTRLYFDYTLDHDFFLFYPSLANSRALRLGVQWKYR